jgi:hypothetical protein
MRSGKWEVRSGKLEVGIKLVVGKRVTGSVICIDRLYTDSAFW